ncbi:MAG TPA: hypothetical protein VGL91_05620 [Acidobacteriota bacterium]
MRNASLVKRKILINVLQVVFSFLTPTEDYLIAATQRGQFQPGVKGQIQTAPEDAPVSFESDQEHTDTQARFLSRRGETIFLTSKEIALRLRARVGGGRCRRPLKNRRQYKNQLLARRDVEILCEKTRRAMTVSDHRNMAKDKLGKTLGGQLELSNTFSL